MAAVSASKAAADAIREMIVSGELMAGDRLPPERILAQTLGLSRSSVREAVRELSALGILAARQGDGTYVSKLDSQDLLAPLDFALRVDRKSLIHYYELRLLLEPFVASVASANVTPELTETLTEALDAYAREVESGHPDPEALIAHDNRIHKALISAAGNPLIAAIVQGAGDVARRGQELTVVMENGEESLAELRAVVDAVLSRNPARAAAVMTWHITRWSEGIRAELGEHVSLGNGDDILQGEPDALGEA